MLCRPSPPFLSSLFPILSRFRKESQAFPRFKFVLKTQETVEIEANYVLRTQQTLN